MDRSPPGSRKRPRRSRPPSPPASLVRLLRQDKKVLTYFESLQEALAADVQVWKDRARAAEAALEKQEQPQQQQQPPLIPKDKETQLQHGKRSKEPTSTAASRKDDAKSSNRDRASGAARKKEPPSNGLTDGPPRAGRGGEDYAHTTDDVMGVPIDDDILDFDNLSLSSSSSSSSSMDDLAAGETGLKFDTNADDDDDVDDDGLAAEQSVEESTQIAALLAESLGILAEFGVVLTVQPTNNVKGEDTTTTVAAVTESTAETTTNAKVLVPGIANTTAATTTVAANTTSDETKANQPSPNENVATAAAMIVGPKPKSDREIVADLVDVLRRTDVLVDDQARIFRALVWFDGFHERRAIVDRLLQDRLLGHHGQQWQVWLYLWRNDLPSATVAALSFLLDSVESDDKVPPRIANLDAALFPPDSIVSLLSTGGTPWLGKHIESMFGADFSAFRAILKIAFDYLRGHVVENEPAGDDDGMGNVGPMNALRHIENSFGWATTDDEDPDVEKLLAAMRKAYPTTNTMSENQVMQVWRILMKILLVTLEKESVAPEFGPPNNEEEWGIVCYLQRFRFMDAIRQHEPINSFPSVDASWTTRGSVNEPLRLGKRMECAALLADGQDFIDSVQALLQQQQLSDEPPTGVIQSLRSTMDNVLVRVINLEQRKDRLTAFVGQCMREGLLCIRGVTPFDPSSTAEYGNYAYDGRGRLLEANNRLESFVSGGISELDKAVASHWIPNNLKPFDRDAPAKERLVRISPTERACALSHVSCWRGIRRSLIVDPNYDSPSQWVRNPGHLHRLFKISGFASGAALLAENAGMPPAPVCVVLEDDAMLVEGFAQKLADILQGLPRDFHFCSLGYSRPKSAPIIPLPGTLVGVPSMLWYLTGYCLSARGVDYLLESLPVVGPVDSWIGLKMAHENWDNSWGMTIGIGAHAQPESLPKRKDLAEIVKFHAYCALKPLCSQKVRVDATRTAGSVMAAPGSTRNWRQRDTDVEYSGHIL